MRLSELTKPEIDTIVGNANFTEEELDVFYMAAGGKSIENISHKLSMSESTVSRRMKKILEKSERVDEYMNKVPVWEKVALTVEEASEYSNIGLNKIREMMKDTSQDFVLSVGGRKLIKRKEFERYISKTREI